MKWHDARYWYFCTGEDMGKTMSLNPRTPSGMSDDEPNTKRICVAPTAAHCMIAIDINYKINDTRKLYVYRTRRQVKARVPYDVYDSHITKEHWLMTRTRFTLVEVLDIPRDSRWTNLGYNTNEQKRDYQAVRSWCRRRRPELAVKEKSNQLWSNK